MNDPVFVEVNLPFSWGDIEWDDEKPEQECFRDVFSNEPGTILDCLTDQGRKVILVGHINSSVGCCGCCVETIRFVYRMAKIDLSTLLGE